LDGFFAPCPRGLEGVLTEELQGLGAANTQHADGGVSFDGKFALAYTVNLHSRIASRVLWRVAETNFCSEDDIYRSAYDVPWGNYFDVDRTIRVNVTALRAPIGSVEFTTLRIKDAVCDRFRADFGRRPDVNTEAPDVRIHAFLEHNRLILYLDTSGEPLFKRGLRKTAGEAPLRENLAAGILRLVGWTPGMPLLDPMCGSGTFLLEAAQRALRIAPGLSRDFGFAKLRNFDPSLWQSLHDSALAQRLPAQTLPIYGSDLYGDELKHTRINAEATGLGAVLQLKQANFLELSAPAPTGVLVTNPPYGMRIGEDAELAALYPLMGDVLKKKFSGWRAAILTADLRLAKLIRLQASRRTPLFNGAIECRLFQFELVSGSNRSRVIPVLGASR
jgi:putative N6-adenine-specific DNA methylase